MLYFLISFLASTVGAVCGIGGGVIIRPVLDLAGRDPVDVISFLSGTSVLAMSCYSVLHSFAGKRSQIDTVSGTPLAIGAAIGGIAGKELFSFLLSLLPSQDHVGIVQEVCLAAVMVLTLIYSLNRGKIRTGKVKNRWHGAAIGLALGLMSSFLGIGGGPINLMVLSFFYSMDPKKAASNSLYIILISRAANLFWSIVTGAVPEFSRSSLLVMIFGGITGGIAGRALNKKLSGRATQRLFEGVLVLITGICICSALRYADVL